MKKIFTGFLILFSIQLFGQASPWEYREETRQLLYEGQPFPPYHPVVCPLGIYDFIPFASNAFELYGWKKISEPFFKIENEASAAEEKISRGWLFSSKRPQNIPQDWLYFPESRLWTSPQGFFRLYRRWTHFYSQLPELDFNIHNRVQPHSFYVILTPLLPPSVREVKTTWPSHFFKVYQKTILKEGRRELLIFYSGEIPGNRQTKIDQIRVIFVSQDFRETGKNYFLIYQNDTNLISSLF